MKFGVIRFPGSCDEVDAQLACQRVGEAVILWHGDHDLQDVDAVVVPGGFSYGDYLRAGAIARFAPVMEQVAEFAAGGGLVLGICNGFQVLCEAGLLPGALLTNTSLRFIFRQVDLDVVSTDSPFTQACEAGERLSVPVKHMTGCYYAPPALHDELTANDQILLRYAPGHNPNGSLDDIAGVCNEARNVFGLMPHPEHAVDPLTGSTDGLEIFTSIAAHVADRVAVECRPPMATDTDRHRALGLTDGEYELIVELLGRPPGDTELAMLSLMWSEHCAYKHSKKLLRRLPTAGPHVLMGPGENAGVVDVGGGLGVAFKVESHNHPSAVEPFQGAATGVGGILRDVFAVGARPIAVLDSLRFGEPADSERSRYLLEHAVAGIGHYGNSIGVPTVGGEIYFEPSYEQNCLVNAMCLGLAPHARLIRSAAAGPGNVLVLYGALTGRDGIGGASVLASAELVGSEGDGIKRPSVQIGDPFAEKKLLECSLELLDSELLVSLQDLGAAGLTSSASEMASKGGVGLDIECARVPLREPGMAPFEIMVSESQERMLCVVEPAKVDEAIAVCGRWETLATPIGVVTDSGRMRILSDGEVVADLPVGVLVDDCPLYDLEPEWSAPAALYPPAATVLGVKATPNETLLALLASSNIASRQPVFEQYDPVVQSRTVRRPDDADAAVLTLPTGEAIAVAIDGNGRRVACDPRAGAIEAVYECAANLACVGAEPLGLTNCLNFGNPEKPHVAWQLTEAVEGIAQACEALGVPVVGGNVSLYNEAPAGPIYPTPVIGMVGRLPDPARAGRLGFAVAGDAIAVVGVFHPSPVGSELAKLQGEPLGGLPGLDREAARAAHETVRRLVNAGAVRSAHDIAEGGLAVALAECCVAGDVGATVTTLPDADLFSEAPGRAFIVSGPEEALAGLEIIGRVGGDVLEIEGILNVAVSVMRDARARGISQYL